MRTLDDASLKTIAPLEVVNWTNEEGSRFSPPTFGSQVFCGLLEFEFAMTRTDKQGIAFRDALADIGYAGDEKVGGRTLGPYFELHIEQGPVLEESGAEIGIVTGCFAARYFVVTVRGMAGHVGPAPMDGRKDALVGAARVILEVDRIGQAYGPDGRSNAPHIDVFPNVRGVIPGEAKVSCDLRHRDQETVARMEEQLRRTLAHLASELAMGIDIECYFEFGPVEFDPELTAISRNTAERLGYKHRDIPAVAGHDAISLNNVTPAALIFVPSRDGLSHNPAEFSDSDQVAAGANVLLHAVLAKAGVAEPAP